MKATHRLGVKKAGASLTLNVRLTRLAIKSNASTRATSEIRVLLMLSVLLPTTELSAGVDLVWKVTRTPDVKLWGASLTTTVHSA